MAPVHESELILARELAAPYRVFDPRKDVPHFRKGKDISEAVVFGNFVFVVDLLLSQPSGEWEVGLKREKGGGESVA